MGLVNSTATNCCINLQIALESLTPNNLTPSEIRKSKGFLGALLSTRNRSGFQQATVTSNFPGKGIPTAGLLPKVEVRYKKPNCSTTSTTVNGLCAVGAATPDPYGYLEPEVTKVRSVSGSLTKEQFNRICETPDERLATDLAHAAEAIENAMNQDLILMQAAQLGKYSSGVDSSTTPSTVNILNGAGYANPAALAVVSSEFRKMHTSERPILIGGDLLSTYQEVRQTGGLGANAIGANPNAGGYDIFTDFEVDVQMQALLGDTDSHMMALLPGASQLLEWYKYVGVHEELGKDDYVQTTIDINGVTYDYTLNFEKCDGGVWNWELSKRFDLWCIPDAAYAPCYDFNGKLGFKLGCGDFSCASYMV